jgi:hypothetical protein
LYGAITYADPMSDSRRPRLLALVVTGGPAEPSRSTFAVHAALSRIPDSVIRAFEIEALISRMGMRHPNGNRPSKGPGTFNFR